MGVGLGMGKRRVLLLHREPLRPRDPRSEAGYLRLVRRPLPPPPPLSPSPSRAGPEAGAEAGAGAGPNEKEAEAEAEVELEAEAWVSPLRLYLDAELIEFLSSLLPPSSSSSTAPPPPPSSAPPCFGSPLSVRLRVGEIHLVADSIPCLHRFSLSALERGDYLQYLLLLPLERLRLRLVKVDQRLARGDHPAAALLKAAQLWLEDIVNSQMQALARGVGPTHVVASLHDAVQTALSLGLRAAGGVGVGVGAGSRSRKRSAGAAARAVALDLASLAHGAASSLTDLLLEVAGERRVSSHQHQHQHQHKVARSCNLTSASASASASGTASGSGARSLVVASARTLSLTVDRAVQSASRVPAILCEGSPLGVILKKLLQLLPSLLLAPMLALTETTEIASLELRRALDPELAREEQRRFSDL